MTAALRCVEVRARSLPEALALAPWLLARARATQTPWLAVSVVQGPAVVLGALQRARRVLLPRRCEAAGVRVWRRETTGTAVYVGARGVVWTLALPRVTALVSDATMATVLNRNVRGFLQGLTRVGAAAQYFGREWVAVRHRPALMLGLDATEDGVVLLELWAGWDEGVELPEALVTDEERALDRWRGKRPVALGAPCAARSPEEVGAEVVRAVARRAGLECASEAGPEGGYGSVEHVDFMEDSGFFWELRRVPVGWVERGVREDGARSLRGDVLTARYAMAALEQGGAPRTEAPLEGARWEDFLGGPWLAAP